jgi:hypothetical protein
VTLQDAEIRAREGNGIGEGDDGAADAWDASDNEEDEIADAWDASSGT